MAMNTGGTGRGLSAAINMTPMIDVLLVLLIIFMVAQREMRRGLPVQLPPPPTPEHAGSTEPTPIVLEVLPGETYFVNRHPVPRAQLRARLAGVYQGRPRKVLFVKGDAEVSYAEVAGAVDASRAAGVEVVVLVPSRAEG